MKLSIWSNYYDNLNIYEVVERFISNGIYASELADEHGFELLQKSEDVVSTGKEFAKFLKERNFEISQGHLWLKIKLCSEDAVEKLYKWIDLYEAIGIKNMVLHCDNVSDSDLPKSEKTMRNIEKLKMVADYIKDKEICICLENLRPHFEGEELIDRTVDDLLQIIEAVGSDKLGICLDTGHLNLTDKNHREFILKAGDKLKALHIADNLGVKDDHLMPFNRGEVDFVDVVKALREVGYKGVFNLEIPGERYIPMELLDAKLQYIKAGYDYLMNL